MKCKNCGYEITEDTVFCFNCGSKVESLIISNDSQNNEENTDKNKNLKHPKCQIIFHSACIY